MSEQTKTVHRHEVPIDGQSHAFRLTHSPHAVAAKRIWTPPPRVHHSVEFWVEHNEHPDYTTAIRRTFQVFGTGQPVPNSARIVGTTDRLDGLVWHLYEIFTEEQS